MKWSITKALVWNVFLLKIVTKFYKLTIFLPLSRYIFMRLLSGYIKLVILNTLENFFQYKNVKLNVLVVVERLQQNAQRAVCQDFTLVKCNPNCKNFGHPC